MKASIRYGLPYGWWRSPVWLSALRMVSLLLVLAFSFAIFTLVLLAWFNLL